MFKENTPYQFFASCPSEMEGLLADELNYLDITPGVKDRGGISFETTIEEAMDAIFNSRVASRIFVQLDSFTFFKEKELYEKAVTFDWTQLISLTQTFKIKCIFDKPAKHFYKNSMHLSQVLKDAVVDQIRKEKGARPDVDTKLPDYSLLLRVTKVSDDTFKASILLDLCGTPLSNRGYRAPGHEAPLRENLAAGIILATDWNPEEDLFIDSMCGTGTLLIEAILIKYNIPAAYIKIIDAIEKNRASFAFVNHDWFINNRKLVKVYDEKCNEYYDDIRTKLEKMDLNQFYGYDNHNMSLTTARENIRRAHIERNVINLDKQDARNINPNDDGPGIVICNPPYGERLGEKDELSKLYYAYGENLKKNFKGYRAYILTSEPSLRKNISLQTSKRIPFFNGSLECRLLRYDLF